MERPDLLHEVDAFEQWETVLGLVNYMVRWGPKVIVKTLRGPKVVFTKLSFVSSCVERLPEEKNLLCKIERWNTVLQRRTRKHFRTGTVVRQNAIQGESGVRRPA